MDDEESDSYASAVLDRHFELLEQLHNVRGGQRDIVAEKLVLMSQSVAAEWRRVYPNEGLPENPSFTRAAIAAERGGFYERAIEICQKAIAEGWRQSSNEDWQHRINRCSQRLRR